MIKFREKTIFILDENGDTMPFQIEELQTELADCFNKGNLAHESSYAEDIILSLDYFLNREDAGSLCTVQELNQMVASMLDEAGFFEIAEIYRSKKNFLEPLYPTTEGALSELLQTKVFFPTANLTEIVAVTAKNFASINVSEAPLPLIVEMAKFVNISLSSINNSKSNIEEPQKITRGYYIRESSIRDYLVEELSSDPILSFVRVGGVSKIHSAIKLYVNLSDNEEFSKETFPLMELELADSLYNIGKKLDSVCDLVKNKCSEIQQLQSSNLPIYLNFINIKSFICDYMGADWAILGKKLCRELSDMVLAGMSTPVYRVIFKEKSPIFEKK